jgi:hypothetical protein
MAVSRTEGRARTRRARRPRSTLRRGYAAVAAAGVVIGVVAGGLQLVDWLESRLDNSPPASRSARITSVKQRSAAEPLGDYLDEVRPKQKAGFDSAALVERGYVYNVTMNIEDVVGRDFNLKFTVHRAGSGARLREPIYNYSAGAVSPESPKHVRTWPFWVAHPPGPGRYFVRFTLTDDKDELVDERSSKPFSYP